MRALEDGAGGPPVRSLARLPGRALGVAVLCLGAACGGGGGDGAPPARHTLTVNLTGPLGGGRVTSAPAGIDCPGSCSAAFDAGTSVALAQAPAEGYAFTGWGGGCGGGGACLVSLAADATVSAGFDGPTEVTVSTPYGHMGFPLSLLPGETLTVPVRTSLAKGAPGLAALAVTGLPAGVSASLAPPAVPAGISATLAVTAATDAPAGGPPAAASVVATSAYGSRSAVLPVEVRSPRERYGPVDLAYEADGVAAPTTALVLETVPGFEVGRLVRVDLATLRAVRTLASGIPSAAGAEGIGAPRALAVDLPARRALVAHAGGLARVDLLTGALDAPAPALGALGGVAFESPASALAAECGAEPGCTAGRLSRVDLDTGAIAALGSTPLHDPAHVLVSGLAYVAERGAGRVLSVAGDGTVAVVAEGLLEPTSLVPTSAGALLVTEAGGAVSAVGPSGGPVPFLELPGAGAAPAAIARSPPWSGQEVLVATRAPDRLLRLRLIGREPSVDGPAPGQPPLVAPRAFVAGWPSGHYVTDCGPGGEAGCAVGGRVVRVDAGESRVVAGGLSEPRGIALHPSEVLPYPLLVAEHGADRLIRVDAETGDVAVVATGIPGPWGVVVEDWARGLALVSAADGVYRADLRTGGATLVAGLAPDCGPANHGRGIAVGTLAGPTAYVAEACPPQVTRIDLASGERTRLPLAVSDPVSVWASVGTPFVLDAGQGGRLLGSPSAALLSGLEGASDARGDSPGGPPAWLTEAGVATAPPARTWLLAQGLEQPSGIALEPSANRVLAVDCGASPACEGTGRLVSVDVLTGELAVLFAGLSAPAAVVREDPQRVLVVDCETAATCATAGRLSRVEGGTRTTLAGGLADPAWVALEPSGGSALVAERAAGRIVRVSLASGKLDPVASGLAHPRQVVPWGGGATALVVEDGRIASLDLASGTAATAVPWDAERFAVDPSSGLLWMLPRRSAPPRGQLLATGHAFSDAIEILGVPTTDAPDTLVFGQGMGRLYWTERRSGTGALYELAPP
jgi:hypothetical protein